jgi:hypothetical protein
VKLGVRTLCRLLLFCAVLFLTFPRTAAAEWQFTPFIGYTFKATSTFVDFDLDENRVATDQTRINFGGAVRLIGESPFGVEAYYVHTPGFFDPKRRFNIILPVVLESRTYSLMGNVVLATPRHWNRYGLRPALSAGIGLMHASEEDQLDVIRYRMNLLGMNIGGGAIGFVSDRVGVRFDLRYFRNIKGVPPEDLQDFPVTGGQPVRLRYWTVAFGVVIKKKPGAKRP